MPPIAHLPPPAAEEVAAAVVVATASEKEIDVAITPSRKELAVQDQAFFIFFLIDRLHPSGGVRSPPVARGLPASVGRGPIAAHRTGSARLRRTGAIALRRTGSVLLRRTGSDRRPSDAFPTSRNCFYFIYGNYFSVVN
ncbi:unnamed protein product [Linum trigynum]|uniref:Uncharacterized protein n=1 Tax=Linum trigynum TaxID=586398 RepID=A0AAV2EQ03_9ROSI